jgi:PAS domain S-box-containing protein
MYVLPDEKTAAISVRRLTDDALAVSERRYRRLFEAAKDGILILDAETGMIMDANPFLIDLLGYSHEEYLSKKVWELGPFRDIVGNAAKFAELQRMGYVRYEDLALETRDGRRIEVEFVSNVYREDHQDVIQCNIRDISARKRVEASYSLLATAVAQAAEQIVVTDAEGRILYVNPAFEKTTGYAREEALGQNPRILKSGLQDAEFYRRMWAELSSGEVWRGRFVNKRKDGTLYEEEASIAPVRNDGGKIVSYVASKRDVTREVHLENQLRQAQKMEAVGRLAGGVAHDFNNLLMGIMGYAELCREKVEHDHPLQEWLGEITRAAERSAEITRQLLAFARKQTIAPKVLDLNDAVAGMLKLLRRLIGEDVDLLWRPGAGLRAVRLDPSQVDQLLANLCLNARDAIGGVGKITLETGNATVDAAACAGIENAAPGTYVCLTVSDDGSGVDPETLTHIFEPFFTTKAIGKGTGLGLATVYGIVSQNSGFIQVDSELGKGTAFKIYLPPVAADAVEEMALSRGGSPKGRGETILLVEDENALRVTCSLFLEALGYNVLLADTPEAALKVFDRNPGGVHLLLTDVVMPGMDGRQLAMRISAVNPDIDVLFMSGYTADVIAERGVLEQNTAFIAKPFTRDDLARKVREVLDTSKDATRWGG